MADGRRLGLTPQLDIEQILREAQHRWLRPAEICEILRNYHKFRIAPEPPNRPSNGSLFLFDRKVLRYFRKDGHNWRKKKDGKTVKEAHEKLKAGSVDVLHCYYAHGEDNENFQRRSYWMLEEELMHIVLVHYREVKGGKASYLQQREDGESIRNSNPDSPACSNSSVNLSQVPSQISDYGSPNSTHQSEYEDADSDNYQSSTRYHSVPEVQQYGSWMNVQLSDTRVPAPTRHDQCDHQRPQAAIPNLDSFTIARDSMTKIENPSDVGLTFTRSNTKTDIASWHDMMESCPAGFQTPYDLSVPSSWAATFEDNLERNSFMIQDFLAGDFGTHKEDGTALASNIMWQFSANESDSLVENSQATEENVNQMSDLSNKEHEGLKKYDSFSRWMSKELGEVDDSQINSNSGIYWSSLESESVVAESNLLNQEQSDTYLMGPLLSQEQLFSIIDFSPNWAYTDLVTKVIVKGKFLMNEEDLQKYKWSCMFGEIEVAANILANGTLSCYTPPHKSGRVPFYITCSNRVACSEIREFEYKKDLSRSVGIDDLSNSILQSRFEKLLLLDSMDYSIPACSHLNERSHADCTICSLIMEVDDETINLFKHDEDFLHVGMKNEDIVSQLKQKLRVWLLHKVGEGDGKGPNVLDEEGQGVLHLAAALGYDWAIKPTVAAGVNINFRDVHGWTAMHWAASCGRERTVVTLIALDASPGALTDPTPEFPTGRTPADLASRNGHKGIAGFLAESSLTNHLRALNLKGTEKHNLSKPDSLLGFENLPDRINANLTDGEIQTSLRAVRNATEAAARIFQVFRVQSFNRKQIIKQSDEKFGMSEDRALSLISVKPYKSEQHNMPFHAAAIKIQNKFRGWKGRKEFLITRQRIVKIQAHVRGHQVRKHYKKIIWSVGIVEKVILRWRRKGSGLRGFRPEGLIEGPKDQTIPKKEDDDDFLREGRRQTEVRMEKALARVKSMVQYPEARDQYRRLVTVVTQLQESKLLPADDRNETAGPSDADFMTELEGLIGDCDVIPFRS
ncbi:calmodulin-binding transcription activator 3-like isoform X2 [Phalaenopsis equestris]|uniref:calmodulin-binding transcription activator 3-like isoform X2 n=1 Tax=Phalaenopsis equestris TaxID=78828 RepID=UPI0009E18EFC|nr:calmodulin-binding transcription activator 3-like isoform X2 [Phalaenopsis equestris]